MRALQKSGTWKLEPCTFSPFKLLVDLYHQGRSNAKLGRLKAKMVAKSYSWMFGL